MTDEPVPIRGTVLIRVERCKGCEFCVAFCPQKVLVLSTELNPKGYHYPVVVKDVCINCSLCATLCPEYAIHSRPAKPGATVKKPGSAAASVAVLPEPCGGSNS